MKYRLGVFIDGTSVRIARVSKGSGRPVIEALETFTLFEPLERREVIEQSKQEAQSQDQKPAKKHNPFGLDSLFKRTDSANTMTDASSNIDVIIKMLNALCSPSTGIAFNLSDLFTFYKLIAASSNDSNTRAKKLVWQAFSGEPYAEAKAEHIGFLRLPDYSLFGLFHDDPMVFCSLLLESFSLLRDRPPTIALIDSTEFALAHEIIQQHKLGEQEQTSVIFFSQSYTKIFFMRGNYLQVVLPTIYEGAESESVCETAFAKILFEFDSGKLSALDNIILVGEVERVRGEKFFKDKWPSAKISRLEIVRAQLAEKLEVMHGRTSPYAVPIALALKSLADKPKPPYVHNFLPRRIRDKQSIYRIAWHGILLLVILFCSVVALTVQSVQSMQRARQLQQRDAYLSTRMTDLNLIAEEVDSLRAKIQVMETGTALIDSLNKVSTRWSPIIASFSTAYEAVGPFSFIKLEATNGTGCTVETELAQERQVALLERMIPQCTVTSVVQGQEAGNPWIKARFTYDIKKTD
jgi:hypothetical protein